MKKNKNKNKKLPLVSIILNCYNSAKFLDKSIKSVLKQSYKNWELIVFDNNSADNTKEKLIRYKRKDKRIRYFKSKRLLNLYHARNIAIKKTKGEFVSFIDADDWWLKDKIKSQIDFFQKNVDVNIIYSNLYIFYEKKNKKSLFSNRLYNGNITQLLLNEFKMPILTTMIKRKVLLKHKFDQRFNIIGDFDLFIRLSLSEKIYSLRMPLACYRIHDTNMTKKRLDLNIKELEKWSFENKKKVKFKNINFKNLDKLIHTLKIKKLVTSKKIYKSIKEIFKSPFDIKNLRFLLFLLFSQKFIEQD